MAKQRSEIHAKVTPINVPVYELPEFIYVETRWVTNNTMDMEKMLPTSHVKKVKFVDNCTMTHAAPLDMAITNPSRERFMQTDAKQTSDKSIQCYIDDEWEKWASSSVPTAAMKDVNREEVLFLNYVSENTSMFPNGMLECMVCGEVALALQEHQNHMSCHYSPRLLCDRCGLAINNLLTHNYECSEYSRAMKVKRPQKDTDIMCPHLQCQVTAKSTAHLRQHIRREHLYKRSYRCQQCSRCFHTLLTFILHRQVNKKCLKAQPAFLYRYKGNILGAKSNPKRCSVCFKYFISALKCSLHRNKCLKAHLKICARKLRRS